MCLHVPLLPVWQIGWGERDSLRDEIFGVGSETWEEIGGEQGVDNNFPNREPRSRKSGGTWATPRLV